MCLKNGIRFEYDAFRHLEIVMRYAEDIIDDLNSRSLASPDGDELLAEAAGKIKQLLREKTDAQYMLHAYYNMLGPTGLKVANKWMDWGVRRIHFDWGPEAGVMSGEERAQFILDIEKAPSRIVENIDG